MADSISNTHDLIDSRDVIKRLEELESEHQDLLDQIEAANEAHAGGAHQDVVDAHKALADWDDDNGDELKTLKALADGAEGYSGDWNHGATLIRDSYFETYAREFAEDLHGRKVRDAEWPFSCVDWEKAASELQQDYTSVDFDGVDYWVR